MKPDCGYFSRQIALFMPWTFMGRVEMLLRSCLTNTAEINKQWACKHETQFTLMCATVIWAAVKQQSDGILDFLNILLMALCALRGGVLWWRFCNCLCTVNNSARILCQWVQSVCFVWNCLPPRLKTKPFVNYCNLVNRYFPFSPKFRSWLFQLEIKWNGPFRNVVFPAQAEYSYCFDDFRLKILFYYS